MIDYKLTRIPGGNVITERLTEPYLLRQFATYMLDEDNNAQSPSVFHVTEAAALQAHSASVRTHSPRAGR
jgi:hypothetical protein